MSLTRGTQKVERYSITLVPEKSEAIPFHVPTTFDRVERVYEWKHSGRLDYLIVPTKISNNEVKIDLFVNPARGARLHAKGLSKAIGSFSKRRSGRSGRDFVSRPSGVPRT